MQFSHLVLTACVGSVCLLHGEVMVVDPALFAGVVMPQDNINLTIQQWYIYIWCKFCNLVMDLKWLKYVGSTSMGPFWNLFAPYDGNLCYRQNLTRQDIITAPSDSRFQIDVEANWTESSKVTALLKELEALRSSGSKSIVFSQWTAFLDLLEIPLKR